jgi:hypothetical protein
MVAIELYLKATTVYRVATALYLKPSAVYMLAIALYLVAIALYLVAIALNLVATAFVLGGYCIVPGGYCIMHCTWWLLQMFAMLPFPLSARACNVYISVEISKEDLLSVVNRKIRWGLLCGGIDYRSNWAEKSEKNYRRICQPMCSQMRHYY